MALLKNFLTKSTAKPLFPQNGKSEIAEIYENKNIIVTEDVVATILANKEFMEQVYKSVAEELLEALCKQYDFTPTDKYLAEVADRKKYIGQLDAYLEERKGINAKVENELQLFLQETATTLSKALDTFTLSVEERIKQAEGKHGIDSIKETVLSVNKSNGGLK